MAYQINKTDGSIVATVPDGQIDTLSTDITLIGKNYSGFGESLNENLIKLLENFSSTTRPTRPIKGQIWFDSSELKLKVYTGTEFVPVSSATIATAQPNTLGVGDLWWNSIDKQLYFYDGTESILLGPLYSLNQGLSGFKVVSVLDTLNQTRVITLLYTNGILLGIFSKDSFTPKVPIVGFSGAITPGFNSGSLAGIKFATTSTNSEQLGGIPATTYLRSDTSNSTTGQLRIETDLGLIIGNAGSSSLRINNGNLFLSNSASEKNIILNVRKGIDQEDAMRIESTTRTVSFYPGFTSSVVSIAGNLTVDGNLTVNGTTTSIDTAILQIEDKNIELAKSASPSDALADGGGILLKGTQTTAVMPSSSISGTTLTVGTVSSGTVSAWMKLTGTGVEEDTYITKNISGAGAGSTWEVSKTQTVASTTITGTKGDKSIIFNNGNWNSTENLNLAAGKSFKINGVEVLSSTSLGIGITSIPGVTSFGKQTFINIGPGGSGDPAYLRLEDNKIEILSTSTSPNLVLEPYTSGNIVLNNSPKITGLAAPAAGTDAANKEYVDSEIETHDVILSIDLSDGKPNDYIITNILNKLAPPPAIHANPFSIYRNGTYARILCNILSTSTVSIDINPLISQSTAVFNTPSGTASAITNIAVAAPTVPAQPILTTRIIKTFRIVADVWQHQSDEVLPA